MPRLQITCIITIIHISCWLQDDTKQRPYNESRAMTSTYNIFFSSYGRVFYVGSTTVLRKCILVLTGW